MNPWDIRNDDPEKSVVTQVYGYDLDQYMHGPYALWWYPAGKLKIMGQFDHGLKHGRWRHWSRRGRLVFDVRYDRGKLIRVLKFGNS